MASMREKVESFKLIVKPGLRNNKQAQTKSCLAFRQSLKVQWSLIFKDEQLTFRSSLASERG